MILCQAVREIETYLAGVAFAGCRFQDYTLNHGLDKDFFETHFESAKTHLDDPLFMVNHLCNDRNPPPSSQQADFLL